MTKPKKLQYQIQYTDNTYRVVDWTKAEFQAVCVDLSQDKTVSIMEDGVFSLVDVRAIVLIPEIEPEPEQEINKEGQLTEWGFVDFETATYLKSMGIDLTGGGK